MKISTLQFDVSADMDLWKPPTIKVMAEIFNWPYCTSKEQKGKQNAGRHVFAAMLVTILVNKGHASNYATALSDTLMSDLHLANLFDTLHLEQFLSGKAKTSPPNKVKASMAGSYILSSVEHVGYMETRNFLEQVTSSTLLEFIETFDQVLSRGGQSSGSAPQQGRKTKKRRADAADLDDCPVEDLEKLHLGDMEK